MQAMKSDQRVATHVAAVVLRLESRRMESLQRVASIDARIAALRKIISRGDGPPEADRRSGRRQGNHVEKESRYETSDLEFPGFRGQ